MVVQFRCNCVAVNSHHSGTGCVLAFGPAMEVAGVSGGWSGARCHVPGVMCQPRDGWRAGQQTIAGETWCADVTLGDNTARSPANRRTRVHWAHWAHLASSLLCVPCRHWPIVHLHFRSRAASLSFTSHHLTVTRQSPARDKRGIGGYLLAFAAGSPGANHPWNCVLSTPTSPH